MNIISVYHSSFGDGFKHVANVKCDTLEEAYCDTNSIHHHWSDNNNVETLIKDSRSTSIDDFLKMDGKWFKVNKVGFVEVDFDHDTEIAVYHPKTGERSYETITLGKLMDRANKLINNAL